MINELLMNNLQLKEGDIHQLERANPIALFLGDSGNIKQAATQNRGTTPTALGGADFACYVSALQKSGYVGIGWLLETNLSGIVHKDKASRRLG